LDVRSTAEYAAGHIVNAQSAPADELQNKLTALAQYKSRPVVVVCANGMRGRAAVQQLEKAGFAKARLLAGGMAAWRDERLPVAAAKR
jgi:rhodanese-related sulfurtransferase